MEGLDTKGGASCPKSQVLRGKRERERRRMGKRVGRMMKCRAMGGGTRGC